MVGVEVGEGGRGEGQFSADFTRGRGGGEGEDSVGGGRRGGVSVIWRCHAWVGWGRFMRVSRVGEGEGQRACRRRGVLRGGVVSCMGVSRVGGVQLY